MSEPMHGSPRTAQDSRAPRTPWSRDHKVPLIGMTSCFEPARWSVWVREAVLLPASYVRAVDRSGGVPVLLSPTGDLRGVSTLVHRLDALVLAGGGDLDPELYGAAVHQATGHRQPQRDRFELALIRAAMEAGLPFLAISRGMQLLNVAMGGDLIQHLPDVVGHEGHAPATGRIAGHRVQISPKSRIGEILGETANVATSHHQAVQRLGEGLVAVAWAGDQVVEAIELRGHPFGVGVQWHPEEGDDLRLFEALVAAARDR